LRVRLRNLFVEPHASVRRSEGDSAVIKVDGLVCDAVCERRTMTSLRNLPGVRQVTHVWGSDEFSVSGVLHLSDDGVDQAVRGVVIFGRLRHLLARIAPPGKPRSARL
jgi:hypothetical protein